MHVALGGAFLVTQRPEDWSTRKSSPAAGSSVNLTNRLRARPKGGETRDRPRLKTGQGGELQCCGGS
jgi:hypothetical protein